MRAFVRKLGMRRLQVDPFASEQGPVLTPVELECLAGLEDQRYKGATAAGLLLALAAGLPDPHERCDAPVGAVLAQGHKIGVHLLHRALLFT